MTTSAQQPSPPSTGLSRQGSTLVLDGAPWRFTGLNAFSASTLLSVNRGCGPEITNLDAMFRALRPSSVVRVWAFQALAWNDKKAPSHLDFTAIDRVVAAAERGGQRLILTLADQAGTCDDGHWHDQSWYDGGYRQRFDDYDYGNGDRSYLEWVRTIVTRYKDSPAVAFWEPVNEPEGSDCQVATGSACYGATRTCNDSAEVSLRTFFDAIGGEIHRLDPGSLVSTGVIGRKQCGVSGGGFTRIAASPEVDVVTYHDYHGAEETLPPDLQSRLDLLARDSKPLIIEEAGIMAGPQCRSVGERAQFFAAKLRVALDHGAVGYLPWNYQEVLPPDCSYAIGPGDPALDVLRTSALN